MRIGIDCRVFSGPMCGIARYTANLINALSEIGNDNQYILFSDRDFSNNLKLSSNFQKVILKRKSNLIWEQFKLPQALMRHKIDIFHCPQNQGVPYNKKWKVVLTIHDLIPKIFSKYWVNRSKVTRIMYNLSLNISVLRADKIIAVSENSKRDIISVFGLPEDKIVVVRSAVEPKFEPVNNPILYDKNRFGIKENYILHIGGIGFNKNTEVVLSVYENLKKNASLFCQLVIIGNRSWFSKEVLNKAKELDGIIFTDFVSDEEMQLLYSGATLFLYPSLYEGFGFPVLEAMACGTPVVVSKIPSLVEVVGDAGLYVNPYDVEEISKKVLLIFKNTNLKTQLIQRGLMRVEEFSWGNTAAQTLKIYKEVMN